MCVGVLYGDSFDEKAWQGFNNTMFKSTYIYMLVSFQFSTLFFSVCVCACMRACVCALSMAVHLTKEVWQGLSYDF